MDGENTFDLVERDGDFIQTVKLSDNGNYLTTYINGEEYIFYKDNAEINIPLGANADADEESFGGTWVTEYEGYNILLTVEDGDVSLTSLKALAITLKLLAGLLSEVKDMAQIQLQKVLL